MRFLLLLCSPRAIFCGLALTLGDLALACGPTAAVPPTPPPSDPFAVVRATSEAAYQAGRTALEQGDLVRGCPAIDTAKTTDPDNRADIQAALEGCLTQIPLLLAATAPPAATAAQRPIVVATLPAGPAAQPGSATTPSQPASSVSGTLAAPAASNATVSRAPTADSRPRPSGTPISDSSTRLAGTPLAGSNAPAEGQPTAGSNAPVEGQPTTTAQAAPATATRLPAAATAPVAGGLVTFRDPQGRFSIGAPADWTRVDQPQTLFGTGVVEFRDATERATLDAAVDTSTRSVSPELYAASVELAMQQQVAGYALEQIQPGSVSGNPSIRRVFTFTQRDASGQDRQARAFQTVVIKGQTPYILTGAAPADRFAEFGALFDQMVESFRFS